MEPVRCFGLVDLRWLLSVKCRDSLPQVAAVPQVRRVLRRARYLEMRASCSWHLQIPTIRSRSVLLTSLLLFIKVMCSFLSLSDATTVELAQPVCRELAKGQCATCGGHLRGVEQASALDVHRIQSAAGSKERWRCERAAPMARHRLHLRIRSQCGRSVLVVF
jgi:hypothetical protein